MRRGLMGWSPEELPLETLQARLAQLRQAMAQNGFDAIIGYTNISRPAAVNWMSGFTPYWSEGVFVLPREGEAQFATALSKRVAEWIETVMPLGVVIPTPKPGEAIGKFIAAQGYNRVGIVDFNDLPAPQANGLMQAQNVTFDDATALFDACRSQSDVAEQALAVKATGIARACMAQAAATSGPMREKIAACELHARRAAAEDIFIAAAPDLTEGAQFRRTDTLVSNSDVWALRLSLAYKGVWVRHAQSFASQTETARDFEQLQNAFNALAKPAAEFATAHVARALALEESAIISWLIEQPRGSYPLTGVFSKDSGNAGYAAQAPCTLSLTCRVNGSYWTAAQSWP
ncbi:MAG: hypothetical protein FJX29_09400 [Alphaproteobacteria bacterium]|nr:hypothetical protein [Alphaproteobacteria bacterium]